MKVERPAPDEHSPSFAGYIARVPGPDILSFLRRQGEAFAATLSAVPPRRAGYRYAEGKWSVREVVGHVIDSERVFAYRALCVARGETQSLPGFDEQEYMAVKPFDSYRLGDLLEEFRSVRASTVSMLSHFDAAAWARVGTANEARISVRALAYVLGGHPAHHLEVLAERYGVTAPPRPRPRARRRSR